MASSSQSVYGNCRAVDTFTKVNRIGVGTYGTVYRGICKITGEVVALKRVILHNEKIGGFPLTGLREINTLKACAIHPNCVKLLEVAVGNSRDSVFLVFEYCEHDLLTLYRNIKNPFKESEIKSLSLQLISAVRFLHERSIIHRDLKLSNLLYNSRGYLKLADFGLSRRVTSSSPMTQKVVSLWYRAPELLLKCEHYTTAIDIWSLGCVIAEFILGKPLMPGDDEIDQLHYIFDVLGCPSEKIWPGVKKLSLVRDGVIDLDALRARNSFNNLYVAVPHLNENAFNLLNSLLTFDPHRRPSAWDLEGHNYFTCSPVPCSVELMPTFPTRHGDINEILNNRDRDRRSINSSSHNGFSTSTAVIAENLVQGAADEMQSLRKRGRYNQDRVFSERKRSRGDEG